MTFKPLMENRILIYAPWGQDAVMACKMLTLAGVECLVTPTAWALAEELTLGVGAVLKVEEALTNGGLKAIGEFVQMQPAWSDVPIVLLTNRGPDSLRMRQAISVLGNVTLLERPGRTLTLMTSLHSVLRAPSSTRCAKPTAARTNFSPAWATNCATRWRRSEPRWAYSPTCTRARHRYAKSAKWWNARSPTSRAWSTT